MKNKIPLEILSSSLHDIILTIKIATTNDAFVLIFKISQTDVV